MAIADVNYNECLVARNAYEEFISLMNRKDKRGYLNREERNRANICNVTVGAFLGKITNREKPNE